MHRYLMATALAVLVALSAFAQQTPERQAADATIADAQAVLQSAAQAGAQQYAASLYDEAQFRIRFAQENWNSSKSDLREQARERAIEGLWAARAALAKARWIGTNAAIRSLQSDIAHLGGTADVALVDEPPTLALNRGTTSKERIAFAQAALDQAKAAGGDRVAPDDLKTAQSNLNSANKVARAGTSDAADYLAYTAEMMSRRAYYMARANQAEASVPPLQLKRTQLAQAETERQAAAERAQREAAERQTAELQRQLAAEQANRQAQQAQLDTLRQQIAASDQAQQQRVEADRAARVAAEQQLDKTMASYESAIASGTAADVETLRRQVEDQQLALRSIEQRQQLNEQQLGGEIATLRTELDTAQKQGSMDAQLLAERQAELLRRQAELDNLRAQREADAARLQQAQQQHEAAIAEATRRRQDAEAKAQQLQIQAQQAQQAAQQAQQAAEQARQQAAATQAELERTRTELAKREADTRRLQMENELARIAATRRDTRGFIVALSGGLLFDTGKTALKPGAKSTLDKIAAQLKNDSSAKIAVEGHTDSVGTPEKNMELSQKRAEAVREYLVGAGVPADRITASGKGEAEPVATNKTAAGRQQNRRVELVITE
jgi:outer membrane protein OmpA-like peptidoglycan-associated protein